MDFWDSDSQYIHIIQELSMIPLSNIIPLNKSQ